MVFYQTLHYKRTFNFVADIDDKAGVTRSATAPIERSKVEITPKIMREVYDVDDDEVVK